MSNVSSPLGRKLEDYLDTYTYGCVLHRPIFDRNSATTNALLVSFQLDIQKICGIAGENGGSGGDKPIDSVSLSTLNSVLALMLSPETFHLLACPPLISACIRLMASIKQSGKHVPFSCEYGYVCFRIILVVFGVCLLERMDELESTVEEMTSEPGTASLGVLSARVADAVRQGIDATAGGRRCDWILGWDTLKGEKSLPVLVPRQDVALLLDLFWEDRKNYLKVLSKTFSPGMSGIMFLFWRYWRLERATPTSRSRISPQVAALHIYELIMRYWLVITSDQEFTLLSMNAAGRELLDQPGWRAELVDPEDCRLILLSYCQRLTPSSEETYAPVHINVLAEQLHFAGAYICSEVKDLLPSIYGSTINHIHNWLLQTPDIGEQYEVPLIGMLETIFHRLTNMLGKLKLVSPELYQQFVEALLANNLIELIARILFLHPLCKEAPNREAESGALITAIGDFVQTLRSVIPFRLQIPLHETIPEWLNCRYHLRWRESMTRSRYESSYFKTGVSLWDLISNQLHHSLDFEPPDYIHARSVCSYARCPGVLGWVPTDLKCSGCGTLYCSPRCQVSDWTQSSWHVTHQNICRGSA